MIKIVFIRHGITEYNQKKMFCGWTDIDLAPEGIEEAHRAGKLLKEKGFTFDIAFTSVLKRAMDTLDIILGEIGVNGVPVMNSWRLNERHYGALQGLRHEDVAKKYSPEQVQLWRRSYATRPPLLEEDDPRYPGKDPKYADLPKEDIPRGESLEDTEKRVMPYWFDTIAPAVRTGKKVIVSASGNSLRALFKHLDSIGDDEIVGLEIKTGAPIIYELEAETLKPIRHYYLESNQISN